MLYFEIFYITNLKDIYSIFQIISILRSTSQLISHRVGFDEARSQPLLKPVGPWNYKTKKNLWTRRSFS